MSAITIGFSPCPNDTFIFNALISGEIDTDGLRFEPVLADVETLNEWALQEKLDVTKLSYPAFFRVQKNYGLLSAGSALGVGVGPLLVTGTSGEHLKNEIENAVIALPGINTTANFLFQYAYPNAKKKVFIPFNEIEDFTLNNVGSFGVLIHENRFTYLQKGLHLVKDLGTHWEASTGVPIPLGCIAVHKRLGNEIPSRVDHLIRKSLEHAWKKYPDLPEYVKVNAQEMDEKIMRSHIELYVNDYTLDLGERGRKAVATMGKILSSGY